MINLLLYEKFHQKKVCEIFCFHLNNFNSFLIVNAKETNACQWIKDSDIVILVVREILTFDDYKTASLRYSSDKKKVIYCSNSYE